MDCVEMLDYITMCQLTILYSFRLRLVSHLYSVDSPVCFFSSSIIIGTLISDFITVVANVITFYVFNLPRRSLVYVRWFPVMGQ